MARLKCWWVQWNAPRGKIWRKKDSGTSISVMREQIFEENKEPRMLWDVRKHEVSGKKTFLGLKRNKSTAIKEAKRYMRKHDRC